MKHIILTIAVLVSAISWSQKEQSFSEQTIEKFAKAYKQVRNENMSFQLNKLSVIEKTGLTSDQFTDIHLKLQNPKTEERPSKSEISKYNLALKNIENLKKDIQKNMERLIEEQGLKVETYHAISKASLENSALKQKIQKLIQ